MSIEEEYDFIIDASEFIGRDVICDFCNADLTDSGESGGILLGTWAVCPGCAPEMEAKSIEAGEDITGRCPSNYSFADWIRTIR